MAVTGKSGGSGRRSAGSRRTGRAAGGARARRELAAARSVLGRYGTRWSVLGLRGYKVSPLSASPYKSLFRLDSHLKGSLTLHLYRGYGSKKERSGPPEAPPLEDERASAGRNFSGPARATRKALASQALWVSSLGRQAGIPVPEPVPADDGSFVVHAPVPGEHRPLRCLLLRWMPGRPKYGDLAAPDLHLVGGYLARLHDHAERFSPPGWFSRPEWGWERALGGRAALWERGETFYSAAEMGVLCEAAERAAEDLGGLGDGPDVFGIVHGDAHAGNLVFRAGPLRRETVCAIDFDRSGWGHYLYDLAVVLRSLSRYGKASEAIKGALLEGYQLERPLPRDPDRPLAACALLRAAERANKALSWENEVARRKEDQRASLLRRALTCAVRYLEDDPRAAFGG